MNLNIKDLSANNFTKKSNLNIFSTAHNQLSNKGSCTLFKCSFTVSCNGNVLSQIKHWEILIFTVNTILVSCQLCIIVKSHVANVTCSCSCIFVHKFDMIRH